MLELGVGTGRNLPCCPAGVTYLAGIDPDVGMLDRAGKRARKIPFPVELIEASAEDLPLEEASFDAVVASLAFCTIPDPQRALREVRRVLKRGGEFRLLEHVRIGQKPIGWFQEKATPLWKRVAGRCHHDRDTLALVREAGFEVERVERHLDGFMLCIFARSPR